MSRSLQKDVFKTFGTRLLSILLMATAECFVSTMLLPAGRGVFTLFLSSFGVMEAISSLGLSISILRIVSKNVHPISDVAFWAVIWGIGLGLAGGSFFYFIVNVFHPSFLHGVHDSTYQWMFVCLPAFLVAHFLSHVMLGKKSPTLLNGFTLFQRGAFLVGVMAMFLVGRGTIGTVTASYSISMLLGALGGIWYCHRTIGIRVRFNGCLRNMLELYRFGVGIQSSSLLAKISFWVDSFIINSYFGHEILGYYSLAKTISESLLHLPISLAQMLMPRVSGNPEGYTPHKTVRICKMTFLLQIVFILCIGSIGGFGIYILLPKFVPSISILLLLLPGIVGFTVFQILAQDAIARGKSFFPAVFNLLSIVLFVIGCWALIPGMGIAGVAISLVLTRLITALAVITAYAKQEQLPIRLFFSMHRDELQSLMGMMKGWIGKNQKHLD